MIIKNGLIKLKMQNISGISTRNDLPFITCGTTPHNIMLVKALGEAIKNRRKELSITQPHLAELAEVSTNTLYKLERGQGNPSLVVLNKLAEVLGMELTLTVNNKY